jgi:hypothetical protein
LESNNARSLFNRVSTAVGPLQGIVAVLFPSVLLGVARPVMTALPTGTIEVVVKNAQGQPLARVS